MATENVVVVTVSGAAPVVVAATDATLIGEVVTDYLTANPSVPEIQVNVKVATRES